jgi:hypothetical protein
MPSFGGEGKPSVPCHRFAACKRSLHLSWKSHAVGKIGSTISCPYFLPSLVEVSHVAGRGAPQEMTRETKNGVRRACLYALGALGLQGPGSAPYSTNQLCLLAIDYFKVFHSSQSYINKHLLGVQLKGVMSLFSFSPHVNSLYVWYKYMKSKCGCLNKRCKQSGRPSQYWL